MPEPIVVKLPYTAARLKNAGGFFAAGFGAVNALYLLVGSISAPPAPGLSVMISPLWELAAAGGGLLLSLVDLLTITQTIHPCRIARPPEARRDPPLPVAARMTGLIAVPILAVQISCAYLLHPTWLLVSAAFLVFFASLCCGIAAYRRNDSELRRAINAALEAAPPWKPEIAREYQGKVRNRYLTRPGSTIYAFRAPAFTRWAMVLLMSGMGAFLTGVAFNAARSPDPRAYLPPIAFDCYYGAGIILFAALGISDIRTLWITRLDVDVEQRTYTLRTTSGRARRDGRPPTLVRGRIVAYSGNLNEDWAAVAVAGTGPYRLVPMWRDVERPAVLLSQAYYKRANAESAMCDISALLQVPMLGMLDA